MFFTSRLGLMATKACSAHGGGRGAGHMQKHTSTSQAPLVTHLLRTHRPKQVRVRAEGTAMSPGQHCGHGRDEELEPTTRHSAPPASIALRFSLLQETREYEVSI